MCRFILISGVIFLVQIFAESLPEGASCFDGNKVAGTCRKANLCASFSLLRHMQRPEVTFCSNDDESIVCCTDCENIGARAAAGGVGEAAFTLDGLVWKTGGARKSYDKCVDYASSLPYPCKNGKTVLPDKVYDDVNKCHQIQVRLENGHVPEEKRIDFPSLVLLGYTLDKQESGRIQWLCQGFIISERYIITTAHCGDFPGGSLDFVAVGVDKRTTTKTPANWQQHKVKRFLKHPEYRRLHKYNDIGLLETETEIEFGVNVLPMCLSEMSANPETVKADVLGLDQDNVKVQIQISDNKECSETFPASRHLKDGVNFTTQACYKGFKETESACIGSSGRPIYVAGDLKCMDYAVGFASFGVTCSLLDAASVYTRIPPYLPWIESVVWS